MSHPIRSLHSRPGVGLAANVVQYADLRFSRIAVDRPALILLKHGQKEFQAGRERWLLRSGDAIAVPAGQVFDVTNRLSPEGLFEARWLVWDSGLLERHEPGAPPAQPLKRAHVLRRVGAEFTEAMDRAARAVRDVGLIPDEVAGHRVAELLAWLASHRVRFAPPGSEHLAGRLRRLFGGALGHEWTMPAVAAQLAMSEATLRRKLSAEGASFSTLLADVRMSVAMTLLQSTDRAVSQIAFDVGYESPSRFAVRFRQRFGFAPAAVRGRRPQAMRASMTASVQASQASG